MASLQSQGVDLPAVGRQRLFPGTVALAWPASRWDSIGHTPDEFVGRKATAQSRADSMPVPYNIPLVIGACLSAIAAILHVMIIVNGAEWYRFFGAGETMARAVEQRRWYPAIITTAIAALLGLWSAYALSGAGVIRALPLLRPALFAITAIYLFRGLVLVPVLIMPRKPATTFGLWSSGICLAFAAAHLVGLCQVWKQL